MKVYIYEDVDRITTNYHDSGGLVIVTDRDPLTVFNEHASKLAEWEAVTLEKLPVPDNVIDANTCKERVYVFPNAGCC